MLRVARAKRTSAAITKSGILAMILLLFFLGIVRIDSDTMTGIHVIKKIRDNWADLYQVPKAPVQVQVQVLISFISRSSTTHVLEHEQWMVTTDTEIGRLIDWLIDWLSFTARKQLRSLSDDNQWRDILTGAPWTNYIKGPIPHFEFTEEFIIIKVLTKITIKHTKQWWNAKWNQTLSFIKRYKSLMDLGRSQKISCRVK